ncbi:hypothetical protein N5O88_12775 [Pseudomonas sp. GD03721]|nr:MULTISPECIES: PA1571 family protein [Pseudomonas]MDH1441067.1 hypothetical protein [Pseudomonas sp. GD03722]MDV5861741.1 hypothetical protein [Pseudomonas mendocina]TXR40842.1 hypothetical protein FVE88_02905 [Pseudomonas mendocina]WGG00006.1 hypothetical protein N5O88_12775 [Pseudomonas sp. GD03721]WGG04170.1 hypothetical protein N5O87_12785 [Pseudomonas sp. GD03919]
MSLRNTANQPQHLNNHARPTPIGGFIIDAQGREVPITEAMIQQACQLLEQSLQNRPQKR